MERPIFSLDVETSGPLPGKHSLVSIGVHEILSGKGFYAELKPEPGEIFEDGPMSVVGGKLICLTESERAQFESGAGWGIAKRALNENGETRKEALSRLREWMGTVVNVSEFDSYEVMAGPSSFDASFILASAGLAGMPDVPCKFSWLCLSSVKRAVKTVLPTWQPKTVSHGDVLAAMCDEGFAKRIAAFANGKHNSYYDAVSQ